MILSKPFKLASAFFNSPRSLKLSFSISPYLLAMSFSSFLLAFFEAFECMDVLDCMERIELLLRDDDAERVLLDRTLVVLVILSVCMYAFICVCIRW